ncbi:MAG: tetratricopeptide repeat protein [Sandaracinaceae bacterium]|nr:tetratricopeptide repeat protein [Sandaracinaceae bacterium]
MADPAPPERAEPERARAEAPARARAEAAPRRGATPRAPAPPPAWVAHAERGEYEEAARLLDAAGALETTDLDVLLLAADTMRLTGQPERALAYLDRAASLAQNDPRAPLVAFTRGRLLLTGLSRPSEAAGAFVTARALATDPSLAMDAAAREVEALARAGDTEAARARAEEYVARYPNGLRVDAVRRWGGLPSP